MGAATRSAREQANLELASRFYKAIFSGDWDTIARSITDDFAVIEAAGLPYGGEYKGIQGFQQLFGALATQYFDGLDIKQKALTANDDYAMTFFELSGTAKPTGKKIRVEIAEITEFKDGKISKLKPFYYDTKAIAAAFQA